MYAEYELVAFVDNIFDLTILKYKGRHRVHCPTIKTMSIQMYLDKGLNYNLFFFSTNDL